MRNYGSQENTFTEPDSRFPSHDDTSKTTRPRSTLHVPAEPLAGFFRRLFVAAHVAANAGRCADRAERSRRVELRKDSRADGLT